MKYRFQWTFPVLISPHNNNTVYVTSQFVHRTTNGGHTWEVISPDLTLNDKSKQGMSGGLTPDNIGVEYANVIYAFEESPVKQGVFWAGTNDGAFRFDGTRFQPFDIPVPSIKETSYKWVKGKVWEIIEDRQGNIWFGRDGYGATKFDGRSFSHFTKEDGLCSNNVASITEDVEGNLWFGCITSDFPPVQEGGVARYRWQDLHAIRRCEGTFRA